MQDESKMRNLLSPYSCMRNNRTAFHLQIYYNYSSDASQTKGGPHIKKTNLFYSFPISQPRIARLMPTINMWGHINSRKLIYKIYYYFFNWDISKNPILPTKKTETGIIGTVKLQRVKELEQKPVTRYTLFLRPHYVCLLWKEQKGSNSFWVSDSKTCI